MLYRCSVKCGWEYRQPTVRLTAVALPIAGALKLRPQLERLVDFVRDEIERDAKARGTTCPSCEAAMEVIDD